jgi:hypothetical protein
MSFREARVVRHWLPQMPDLTADDLRRLYEQLDAVCSEARELQNQIKQQMADAKKRDYTVTSPTRTKRQRKSRAILAGN